MIKSICSISILLMISCTYGCATLLKCKDVNLFNVRETQDEPVSLKISGLAMQSSLAVENVETRIEDKNLVVLVHLTRARIGLRRDFTFNFDVPGYVDSVTFGPDKCLIWKRGVGPVK